MLYGNSSIGFSYSPDRSRDKVNFNNYQDRFPNASGNGVIGYYYSPKNSHKQTSGSRVAEVLCRKER